MKRVGLNAKRIKREIAKAANISVADLDRVFRAVAENDARFAEQWFASDYAPAVKGLPKLSKPIERLLKAQLRITAQAFKNLSQTTIETKRYRKAVDEAISAVQSGVTDYNSAIRRAMKTAAQDGLRVKYPNSGMTRRLDSAVRQNVLDGVRAINNDVLRQLGNEYGADGIEISAHALCATDHLPYQGLQFSNRDFEELQNSLGRPFGAWNCKHTMFPVILGVSVPAHDADELRMYRENSAAEIEIDGRTMSRYEWSQEQRRIETAVRAQKDIAIAAKASGDDVARREAQSKINALQDHYEKVSRAAGLDMQRDRMRVAGFRQVKTIEQLKNAAKSEIIEAIKILLNLVINGTITAFVGEIGNFIIGVAFVLPAALIYKHKKSKKTAMIGLATGGIIMIVASCFINVFILLPAYGKAFGMPVSAFVDMAAAIHSSINSMAGFALLCVAPFNLLKVVLVSVITMLLYKHISPILKGRR